MQINKLTITPIFSNCKKIHIVNPSNNRAEMLIKEKLASVRFDTNNVPRACRKLPKSLKGLVNPNTLVPKNRKIYI